ncbi:hypothetical protein [Niabella drilacis]|uniref:Uncharacterized protein n=1 Tax=Niabella drilacis (strain DSM 25811 / CCM 8410 / CCUG 62505 / LMG 26954 / E90) TaxID=1285928 RepID=A0A1G7C0J6_NIADE|nr:hypothetical protein [Niabella drilacis]SDE32807.1 hypothetical protein SAMN04487894_1369 [Niabella drilacis]
MSDNKNYTTPANVHDRYNVILNELLRTLELVANKRIEETQLSQQLLEIGIDTGLISDFKKLLENPVSHFLDSKDSINRVLSDALTKIVATYLYNNKDIVKHAFRTKVSSNGALHFSIVLKEDTYENRGQLLKFLTGYKQFENWEAHPINFQFVPERLISKIETIGQIV